MPVGSTKMGLPLNALRNSSFSYALSPSTRNHMPSTQLTPANHSTVFLQLAHASPPAAAPAGSLLPAPQLRVRATHHAHQSSVKPSEAPYERLAAQDWRRRIAET